MLHRYCLLISLLGQAVLASNHKAEGDCLPRCCSPGQILDPSGTTCLRNPSTKIQPDPCGRRNSFLPKCEIEEEADVGAGTKKKLLLLSTHCKWETFLRGLDRFMMSSDIKFSSKVIRLKGLIQQSIP